MSSERVRQMQKAASDATSAVIRDLEESGELRHLHGRRLDLSDDSPEWFAHQLLKREGLTPPIIEQGKEIDAAREAAEAIMQRPRGRRAWLSRPETRATPEDARTFNAARLRALDEYRSALNDLNRAILDFNLVAPSPMHRRGVIVNAAMDAAEKSVPPLDEPAPASEQQRRTSRRRAMLRKLRGAG